MYYLDNFFSWYNILNLFLIVIIFITLIILIVYYIYKIYSNKQTINIKKRNKPYNFRLYNDFNIDDTIELNDLTNNDELIFGGDDQFDSDFENQLQLIDSQILENDDIIEKQNNEYLGNESIMNVIENLDKIKPIDNDQYSLKQDYIISDNKRKYIPKRKPQIPIFILDTLLSDNLDNIPDILSKYDFLNNYDLLIPYYIILLQEKYYLHLVDLLVILLYYI